MRKLESEIVDRLGGRAYDFLCEVGGAEPPCHFKFIRRLEILIGSIGCLKWRGCLPPAYFLLERCSIRRGVGK